MNNNNNNNTLCSSCHNTPVPTARVELGYSTCLSCGEREAVKAKRQGYPCYGHKTAGETVITTPAGLRNYRRVSYRHAKGSNMKSASQVGSEFSS